LFFIFIVDRPWKSIGLFQQTVSSLKFFRWLRNIELVCTGSEGTCTRILLVSCECPAYQRNQSICYLVLGWLCRTRSPKRLLWHFRGYVVRLFLPGVNGSFELF
jgi:hypothetical protein